MIPDPGSRIPDPESRVPGPGSRNSAVQPPVLQYRVGRLPGGCQLFRSTLARSLAAAALALGVGVSTATRIAGGQAAQAVQAPAGTTAPAAPRIPSIFVPPEPLDFAEQAGWTSLFDGRTLTGWSGNPDVWSVAGGAITAESTSARRVGSTHIIWSGGEPGDFELKLEMKLEGDIHSGIAYRSFVDAARG